MRYSSKQTWYPLKLTLLVESIVLKFVESIVCFILFHVKDIIIFLLVSFHWLCMLVSLFLKLILNSETSYRIAMLIKNDT